MFAYFCHGLVPRALFSYKATSSPGPSPRSKWRSEKPLAKAPKNTPRIVEYFVTWHMMKWVFRRLFPASGGPVCFLQSETVVQTKRSLRDEILTNYWSHFSSLGQGFLRPPFWTRRRPWGRGCLRGCFSDVVGVALFRRDCIQISAVSLS